MYFLLYCICSCFLFFNFAYSESLNKDSHKLNNIQNLRIFKKLLLCKKNIKVTDFREDCILKQNTAIQITRKFEMNGSDYYMLIDTNTLKFFITEVSRIENSQCIFQDDNLETKLKSVLSKYKQSVVQSIDENSDKKSDKIKFALTIDMCPSIKGKFEKDDLFNWLVGLSKKHQNYPIPISIAITKKWITSHLFEFRELLQIQESGRLKITWVNHSATHPLNENESKKILFLTAKNVNFEEEVLELEKILLEYSQMPSIFFRFPGLVYNKDLLSKLNDMSLVALDSSAWIAKKQPIKNNSIVLLHGNGNEHYGIIKFKKKIFNLTKDGKFNIFSFTEIGSIF
jgi:hypothetical protein